MKSDDDDPIEGCSATVRAEPFPSAFEDDKMASSVFACIEDHFNTICQNSNGLVMTEQVMDEIVSTYKLQGMADHVNETRKMFVGRTLAQVDLR
jgi:hypothetical protein